MQFNRLFNINLGGSYIILYIFVTEKIIVVDYKYHIQLLTFFLLFAIFTNCGDPDNKSKSESSKIVSTKDIFKSFTSDTNFIVEDLDESLSSWNGFNELKEFIASISKGNYQTLDESEETSKDLFSLLVTKIPNTIDNPSIIARIKVTETLAYKLKSNFKNKSTEFEKTKNNLLNSYSNILIQIKKTLEKESQKIINPNPNNL